MRAEVFAFVGLFEVGQGAFDGGFVAAAQLVAVLFELLLGLENHRVGGVHLARCARFRLCRLRRWLWLRRACARCRRRSGRELASMRIFCSLPVPLSLADYVQDAVGVDVEGYFNLRHAAGCGRNAVEVETCRWCGSAKPADARLAARGFLPKAGCPKPSRRSPISWSGWSCSTR